MKSHKVPTATGGVGKIGSREFGGFLNAQMGVTVHNEEDSNPKMTFSGVAGRLEMGKLQR